jgi:hypothetical protein
VASKSTFDTPGPRCHRAYRRVAVFVRQCEDSVCSCGDSQLGRAGTGHKKCIVDRIGLPCVWGGGGKRVFGPLVGPVGNATESACRSACVHSVSNKCQFCFL